MLLSIGDIKFNSNHRIERVELKRFKVGTDRKVNPVVAWLDRSVAQTGNAAVVIGGSVSDFTPIDRFQITGVEFQDDIDSGCRFAA